MKTCGKYLLNSPQPLSPEILRGLRQKRGAKSVLEFILFQT